MVASVSATVEEAAKFAAKGPTPQKSSDMVEMSLKVHG